jgi:hypothetical protein
MVCPPAVRRSPVHGRRVGFLHVLADRQHLGLQRPLAEPDLQDVALFHLVAALGVFHSP